MRFLTIISLLPLALSLSACGKWAKANKTDVVTLPIPEYPSFTDDVFALNSPKSSTEYKGTMLIFNDKTSPELLSEIINASIAARDAWGVMKKFEIENDYGGTWKEDGGSVTENLKLMRDGLQAFENTAISRTPKPLNEKIESARKWIASELERHGLAGERQAAFDKSWGDYCEAKVIEFAFHPSLNKNYFRTFPYPAAICQQYYTDKGFFTGEACTAVADGNYTKCLWIEGVLKTRWFAAPLTQNAELSAKREEKRTRLLALLSDLNAADTRAVFGRDATAFVLKPTPPAKKLFVDKGEAFVTLALDQQKTGLTTCASALLKDAMKDICFIFALAPETVSPREIIDAAEGPSFKDEFFPKLGAPAGREITTHQLLKFLGSRERDETSENDRIFMELFDGSILPQPKFEGAGDAFKNQVSTFRSTLAAEFYGALSEADKIEKASKLETIKALEAEAAIKRARYDELSLNITNTTNDGVTAANAGDASVGLLQYQMKAEQVGPILHIQFWLATTRDQIFRACLDLETSLPAVCPGEIALIPGKSYYDASVSRAADGGAMIFELKVTDAQLQGFGPKARADEGLPRDFFMEMPLEAWEGKTLRFELYKNRIRDYLDIMTGKVFVLSAEGKREYEGAASSWEQAD